MSRGKRQSIILIGVRTNFPIKGLLSAIFAYLLKMGNIAVKALYIADIRFNKAVFRELLDLFYFRSISQGS